ncbi:hypothetical protein PA598K_06707 [Paenibacillus sp. 598K]|uniref:TPM domain-containing protein n=1 Tax=Paenibacillus sp. 598K TaxID=1117987 RepID=UPI000FF99F5D|nr:TPM domain-containing protein [Paenibacillus sp. 598K]GBF78102.1 hypothetical protein PA598K_06707 [Paenibacillus sp. 598K]
MKTVRAVLVMWVLCAIVSGFARIEVVAASLPDYLGSLQDRAGLFTAEQKAAIKEDLADRQYLRFDVLTIVSLNGQDADEYATSIYEHWGLSDRRVLLLISLQDRRATINFHHEALQTILDTTLADDLDRDGDRSESKLTEILDAYFIPHAREGDFQTAIAETTKFMDALGPQLPGQAAGLGEDVSVSVSEAEAQTDASSQEGPLPEPVNWGPFKQLMAKLFRLTFWCALAYLAFLSLWLLRRGQRKATEIHMARLASGELMLEMSRALERVVPLIEGSEGRTSQAAGQLERRLTELLLRADGHRRGEGDHHLHVLQLKKLMALLEKVTGELEQLSAPAERAIVEAHELADLEHRVPQTIGRLREEQSQGRVIYEELAGLLEQPVEALQREFKELEELLVTAEGYARSDALTASEWTGRAERRMAELTANLQELLTLAHSERAYLDMERQARQDVRQVIEEHNLYEREQDIYRILEESNVRVPSLQQALRLADTARARAEWQRIERLLGEARDKAWSLAEMQRSNQEKLVVMEERLQGFDRLSGHLDQEFHRLSNAYKKTLWNRLEQDHLGLKRELASARAAFDQGRERQSRQQFESANALLDDLAVSANKLSQAWETCERAVAKLDADKAACLGQFASDNDAFGQLQRRIATSDVIVLPEEGLEADYRLVYDTAQRFRQIEQLWPLDLRQLQKEGARHTKAIDTVREKFEEIEETKELAVTTLRDAAGDFYRLIPQTYGMFYKIGRKRAFRKRHDEIYAMIKQGYYDDALDACDELESFIDEVGRRAEVANRQREQERIARERARERREAERERTRILELEAEKAARRSQSKAAATGGGWGGGSSSTSSSSASGSSSSSSSSSSAASSSSHSSGSASWSSSSSRSSGGASYGGSSSGSASKSKDKGHSSGSSGW